MSTNVTPNSNAFGTMTSKGQLTAGFATLSFGILLGLAALSLFIFSPASSGDFQWKEITLLIGAAGFPLILLGITLALPTPISMRILTGVGVALCVFATVLLAVHYPNHFNVEGRANAGEDFTQLDTGLYVAGLALMIASVVTSIIGYYLTRVQAPTAAAAEEEDEYGAGYEIPDWVIERDIEQAMKRHGVSWGSGIPEDKAGMQVNIPDSLGGTYKVGGLGKARVTQLDADQVDFSVGKLSGVRPQKKAALPTEWTDQSVAALVNFRKQKQADPKAYVPKYTFWQKVKAFFGGSVKQPEVDRAAGPIALRANGKVRVQAKAGPSAGAPAPARKGKTIVIEDEK